MRKLVVAQVFAQLDLLLWSERAATPRHLDEKIERNLNDRATLASLFEFGRKFIDLPLIALCFKPECPSWPGIVIGR
ncbi:hypothetical protein ACFQVB_38940 [Paraburkholderia humisilvae]|uniref:hypothetical protein n=1 Tax=Paraburkholderia humisilvae TaxID=627669 RepID=UPI003605C5C0